MSSKQFFAVVLCVLQVLSAPSPLVPIKKTKNAIPGRFIVTFKNDVGRFADVSSVTSGISSQSNVTHGWDIIDGFAGAFTDVDLKLLRSNPNIASIEEDGYAHTQIVTQKNAPWGLGRISSRTKLNNQNTTALTYSYDYAASAGANSDVYIIDTGILISHPGFGGRASWGATLWGYPKTDDSGHGTHTAGTAVSGPYGVAKSAKVIAVKVLNNRGTGTWADIISGMNWVASAARNSGRPSVASMSLSGGFVASVNTAAAKLVSSGVTTVVAAGNNNANAAVYSPGSTPSVITVGASTIADNKASYSNYGAVLDIWAPGTEIISTWNDGGINTISGTSMATPHVAGYAACLLTLDSSLTPAAVVATLKSQSLKNVLSGIPAGTTNVLLHKPA